MIEILFFKQHTNFNSTNPDTRSNQWMISSPAYILRIPLGEVESKSIEMRASHKQVKHPPLF